MKRRPGSVPQTLIMPRVFANRVRAGLISAARWAVTQRRPNHHQPVTEV